eukprot:1140842-Pelagomonas_calceolata.AAC.1
MGELSSFGIFICQMPKAVLLKDWIGGTVLHTAFTQALEKRCPLSMGVIGRLFPKCTRPNGKLRSFFLFFFLSQASQIILKIVCKAEGDPCGGTSALACAPLLSHPKRHRSVWPTEDQAEDDGHTNKLAKYHNWLALPFRHNSAFGKPLHVPRYLYLDLGRHMQRNIVCFTIAHSQVESRNFSLARAFISVICVAQLSYKMKNMLSSAALATSCVIFKGNSRIVLLHGLYRVVLDDTL